LKPCKQIALNATHAMDTLADLGTNILQSVLRLHCVTIVSTRAVLVDVLLSVIIATVAPVLTVAKC